jgi:tetraacyldisaccharide 4'-kinase
MTNNISHIIRSSLINRGVAFFERLYFSPKRFDWVIVVLLLPFSVVYGGVAYIRRRFSKKVEYPVPIISIGNLIVGGSGKSPLLISLIKGLNIDDRNVFVISRGYGRESRGLVEVSRYGEILCDVKDSGDEPMLIAKMLKRVSVIVSADRHKAIERALELKAEIIFLDDGFGQVGISKFDIVLFPKEIKNPFTLPAGGFREFQSVQSSADMVLREERDFFRVVEIENSSDRMVLVTAIANPKRLDRWLDRRVVDRYYLKDHSWFKEEELKRVLAETESESILTTQKDFVKMEGFNLPISLMKLHIEIDNLVVERVKRYIKKIVKGSETL